MEEHVTVSKQEVKAESTATTRSQPNVLKLQQRAMVQAIGTKYLHEACPDLDPDIISGKRTVTLDEMMLLRAIHYNKVYATRG